jgi:hypothetical protein
MPLRVEAKNKRASVFLCVLLIHGILGALLTRTSPLRLPAGQVTQSFTIELLPEPSRVQAKTNHPETVISRAASNPDLKPRSTEPAKSTGGSDNEHLPDNAITQPPIDWNLEAESVARNSAGKRSYRDLAGFTPEQLEWMKRNKMAPAPYNPFWDDGRRVNEPGVLWINHDCAIVNLLPMCTFKLGKRKVRGDLFKDMRKYLDERETDPLP